MRKHIGFDNTDRYKLDNDWIMFADTSMREAPVSLQINRSASLIQHCLGCGWEFVEELNVLFSPRDSFFIKINRWQKKIEYRRYPRLFIFSAYSTYQVYNFSRVSDILQFLNYTVVSPFNNLYITLQAHILHQDKIFHQYKHRDHSSCDTDVHILFCIFFATTCKNNIVN